MIYGCVLLVAVSLSGFAMSGLTALEADREQTAFFESSVRPLLADKC